MFTAKTSSFSPGALVLLDSLARQPCVGKAKVRKMDDRPKQLQIVG